MPRATVAAKPPTKPTKASSADVASKAAQQAALRAQVYARQREIVEAQIVSAVGIVHFMKRDPYSGKFERLTDSDEMKRLLNDPNAEEGTHYMLAAKDPSHQAAALLLAYALDQPSKAPEDREEGPKVVIMVGTGAVAIGPDPWAQIKQVQSAQVVAALPAPTDPPVKRKPGRPRKHPLTTPAQP